MTAANCLTLLRIILIPFFITVLIYRRLDWAFAAFVLAALTDGLDGFVARRTRVTTLGRFLDPLADKLLLTSAFVMLPLVMDFPVWVSVIVVSRDVMMASGYLLIYLRWGAKTITVRMLGKVTTFMQSLCVGVALLSMLLGGLEHILTVLAYLAAAVTVVSGLDYVCQAIRATQAIENAGTAERGPEQE